MSTQDLGPLLTAVRDKLLTDAVFTNVYISLKPQPLNNPPDDRYAVIVPGRQTVFQPSYTGASTNYMLIEGEIAIIIWARLMLDEQPHDDLYLTDASLGALASLKAVIRSLSDFGNQTSVNMAEPFRLESVDTPQKTNIPGWGYLVSTWRVSYSFDFV